jgi:hypothetical protein
MVQKITLNADGSLELPGMFQNVIKNPDDIMSIMVDDKKSIIQFKNSECWEKTVGLSDFEAVLDMQLFFRSCHNHLINMSCVETSRRQGRGRVAVLVKKNPLPVVSDVRIEVPVSVRKVDDFIDFLERLQSGK